MKTAAEAFEPADELPDEASRQEPRRVLEQSEATTNGKAPSMVVKMRSGNASLEYL